MKDKNILNRNIKDQFDRERLEPPAFIWENVKTSIDAGKKRKIFPFWIILAIVGGLALDFYLPQKVQEKIIETKTEFSTKQQNIASTTSVNQAVENNANELTNKTLASNPNLTIAAVPKAATTPEPMSLRSPVVGPASLFTPLNADCTLAIF